MRLTPLSSAAIFFLLLFVCPPVDAQIATAAPAKPTAPRSVPKSAAVVNQPKEIDDWEVGDIQVTYTDGHTEIVTKNEKCGHPHVSGKGDVGWSVWNDLINDDRYHHTGETLRVRMRDGTIRNFKPNNLFIMQWGFADDDKAVVIESMAHHGASSYIKYDLATGKELGRLDDYVPYDQMPKWAQPYSDEKP